VSDLLGECEAVIAEHGALEQCVSIEPRRSENHDADLRLLFADRLWLRSPAGAAMIAALRRHPAVAAAQRRKSAVALRFDDTTLAQLERRLAADGVADMQSSEMLDGRRFMVSFVGANTNKALHVGHLRNIVLGEALASTLTAAGGSVQRHSLVGDIGRRVCEAMAGYLSCHDGQTPERAGLAGDRFVERCSRDCPREPVQPDGMGEASEPNAEEREVRGDCADAIMQLWLQGAPAERALWHRMREWVMRGHRRTLARLGVSIDRYDYESLAIERALELVEDGLRRGLFEREPTGAAVYRTGRSEYTTMVLLRKDGVPTEYARLLGLYDLILEELDAEVDFIEVVGVEWQPAATAIGEALDALRHGSGERLRWIYHGSVTVGGQKMGSSAGEVTWIEDLLDGIAASPGALALQELAKGAVTPAQVADMVVRGSFLCSPFTQSFAFFADRHVSAGRQGAGWTIAEAWCRAQHTSESRRAAPPVARTAVVQSQLYRRSLSRSIATLDTESLASYLLGLCEACLISPEPGPAAMAMLWRVLRSLGFTVGEPEVRHRDLPRAHDTGHLSLVHARGGRQICLRP